MTNYVIGSIDWNTVAANARIKTRNGYVTAPAHLQAFIKKMGPAIERYAPAAGLPINVVLAQLAHEAGMMHVDGQYNAFAGQQDPLSVRAENYAGLKGMENDPLWGGPTVSHLTYEYNGGRHVVQHPFRDYIALHKQLQAQHPDITIPPPHELFVRDYIGKLLYSTDGSRPRYHGVFGATDPMAYARALKDGGYYTADAGTYGSALAANTEALMPGYSAPLPANADALARARSLFPAHTAELGLKRLIAPELGRTPAIPGRAEVVDAGREVPRAVPEAGTATIVPLNRDSVRPGFLQRDAANQFVINDQQFLALYNAVRERVKSKATEITKAGITTIKVGGVDTEFDIDKIMPARTGAELPTEPDAALTTRTEMTDRMLDVLEPLIAKGVIANPLAAPARTAARAPFDRDKTRATYEAMTPDMLNAAYVVLTDSLKKLADAGRTTTKLEPRKLDVAAPSEADRRQMIEDMVKASEELHTKGEITPETADRTAPGRPQPAAGEETPEARRRREEREGYERAMNAMGNLGIDGDVLMLMFLFAAALSGGDPATLARLSSAFEGLMRTAGNNRSSRWDGGNSNGRTVPGTRKRVVTRDGVEVEVEDAVSPTNFKKLILPQLDEDTAALERAGRVSPSFDVQLNIGGPIIILDPGHFPNGDAPNKGGSGSGTHEWVEAVAMTRIQKMKLEALGFHVIVTKRDNGSNAVINGEQVAGDNLGSRPLTIEVAERHYPGRVIGLISNHFDGGSATAQHGMIISRDMGAGTGNNLIAQYLLGAGYKPSPQMKVGIDVGGGRLTSINGVGVLSPALKDPSKTFQILIEHAFIQNEDVMRNFLANRNAFGNSFAQAIAAFAIEKGYQLPIPLIDALRKEQEEAARRAAEEAARTTPEAPRAVPEIPAGVIAPEMVALLRELKDGSGRPIYTENPGSTYTAMLDAKGNFVGGNMSFARADGMSIAKYMALNTIIYAASTVGIDGQPKPALISQAALNALLKGTPLSGASAEVNDLIKAFRSNLAAGITDSNNQTIQRAIIAAVRASNPGMSEEEAGKTFVTWMNDTAKAFGMTGTQFSSAYLREANATGWAGPVGWNDGNGDPARGTQYTTAYDQARLGFVSRQFVESIRASNPDLARLLDDANQSKNTTRGREILAGAGLNPADFFGKTGTGEGDFGRYTELKKGSATAYMAVHRTLGYSIAVLEATSGERPAAVREALRIAASGTGVSLDELRKKVMEQRIAAAAATAGDARTREVIERLTAMPYQQYHAPEADKLLRLSPTADLTATIEIPRSTLAQVIARHNPAITPHAKLEEYARAAGIPLDKPLSTVEYMQLVTSGLPLDARKSARTGPLALFNMAGVPKDKERPNIVDLGCAGTISTALMFDYPSIAHAWQNNAILSNAGLTDYHHGEIKKYGMPVDVNVLYHTFKELGVLQVKAGGTAAMGREITFDSLKVGSVIGFAHNEAAMQNPGGSHAAMITGEGTEPDKRPGKEGQQRRYKIVASGNYSVDGSGATVEHRDAGFYTYKLYEPDPGEPLLETPGQGKTPRPILWAADPDRMRAYHLAYMKEQAAKAAAAARVATAPAGVPGKRSTTQVSLDDRSWIELISLKEGERHPYLTHGEEGMLELTGAGGQVKINPTSGALEVSLGKYDAAAGTENFQLAQLTRARINAGLISILQAAQELGHLKLKDAPVVPSRPEASADQTQYLTDSAAYLEANAEAMKALAAKGFITDGRLDFLKMAAAGINVQARPGETLPAPVAVSSAQPIAPITSIEAGAEALKKLGWPADKIEAWKTQQRKATAPVAAVARPEGWKPTFIAFGDSLAVGMAQSSGIVRTGGTASGQLAILNPETARASAGFTNGWVNDMLKAIKHPIAPVTNAAFPETIGLVVLGYNDVAPDKNTTPAKFADHLRQYVRDMGARGIAPVLYEMHTQGGDADAARVALYNAEIRKVAGELSLPVVSIDAAVRGKISGAPHLTPAGYTAIGDMGMEAGRKHNFTEFFKKTNPAVVREVPVAAASDDIYARMRAAQVEAASIVTASMTLPRGRLVDAVPYDNQTRPADYPAQLWNPEARTVVRTAGGSQFRTPSVKAGVLGVGNEDNVPVAEAARTRHSYRNGIQGRPPSLDNIAEFIRTARIDGKPIDGRPPVIPASLHRFATSGFDDPNKNGWVMFSKPMAYGMNGSHAWHVGIKGAYNIYTGEYKYDYYVSGGSDKSAGTELSTDGPAAGLEYRFYRSTAPEDRHINGVNYVGTVIPVTPENPQGYIGRRLGPIFGASVDFVTMNGTNGKMIHKVIGFGTEGCQMMRSNQDYAMFLVNHGLNIMGTREFNFDLDAPTEASPRRFERDKLPRVMPAVPIVSTERAPIAAAVTERRPAAVTATERPQLNSDLKFAMVLQISDIDQFMKTHANNLPKVLIFQATRGKDWVSGDPDRLQKQIAELKAKGVIVGAYVSIGEVASITPPGIDSRRLRSTSHYGGTIAPYWEESWRQQVGDHMAFLKDKIGVDFFNLDRADISPEVARAGYLSENEALDQMIGFHEYLASRVGAHMLVSQNGHRLLKHNPDRFTAAVAGINLEVMSNDDEVLGGRFNSVLKRFTDSGRTLFYMEHSGGLDTAFDTARKLAAMPYYGPRAPEEYDESLIGANVEAWRGRYSNMRAPTDELITRFERTIGVPRSVGPISRNSPDPDVTNDIVMARKFADQLIAAAADDREAAARARAIPAFVDPKDNARFSYAILNPDTGAVAEGNNIDRTTQAFSFAKARTAQIIYQLIKDGKLDGAAFFAQHGQTMANMLQYGAGYDNAAFTLADAAMRMSTGVMIPSDRGNTRTAFMRLMNDRNIVLANGTTVQLSQHTTFNDPSSDGVTTARDMALISLSLAQLTEAAREEHRYAQVAKSRYPDQAFAFRGPGRGTGKIGAYGKVFLWGGATDGGIPYAVTHTDNVVDLSGFVQQTHDRARGLGPARGPAVTSEADVETLPPARPHIRLAAGRELPQLAGVTFVEPTTDIKPNDPYSAAVMHLAMLTSLSADQQTLLEQRKKLFGGTLSPALYYPGTDQPALPAGLTGGSVQIARTVAAAVVPEGVKDKVMATATAEQDKTANQVVAGTHKTAADKKKDEKDKGGEGQTAAV